MNRTSLALCLTSSFALASAGWPVSMAAPLVPAATQSAAQDDAASTELLGTPYENQSAGISLRIPAGCHRIRTNGSGDDLGQFADGKRDWQLKLNRSLRDQPTALASTSNNFNQPQQGLLDETVARLKRDLPGCKVLRSDLTNVRDGDPKVKDNVGMIAVMYAAAGSHFLTQQAIIQANSRLFYFVALTTPDKDERTAVETFQQMLDSVRILDTSRIAQEQQERLWRTRTLMLGWSTAKLHSVLVDEQWVRILRNRKDIGYSYITEQTAAGVPRPLRVDEVRRGMSDRDLVKPGDGMLIGVRARSIDPAADIDPNLKRKGPIQVDSASWLFSAADRRLEDWSRIIVVDTHSADKDGKPIKSQTEEFGASNKTTRTRLDKNKLPGTALDPKQPPVSITEEYTLNVDTVSQSGQGDPVDRQLPPWYIPQAIAHLLPRLVPLHPQMDEFGQLKQRSYMFAVYVPDIREVMERYIDVKDEQDVTFAGRTVRAVPIEDRIGWHGSVTVHYMTPGGVYLGSENKETHLVMIPTDAKTLLSIWKNADLTRPGGTERPRGDIRPGVPVDPAVSAEPIGPQPETPVK
ncbi:MAG TPA: hypothetical protein VGI81_06735 [Tepidisphaeraceae bacterium]|jgi:hypothetical protein